ncbi:MAG: 1-(5-phosphoribosyl)-5-[(5-phosphoribosylamino)methylideneamino]imidazole-4-carboxamide isomerase [Acidimicrobiales bacterium]
MELFPAIDLRGAVAVRLSQGDFSREDRYGDPLSLARRYADGGARWIHVVDLEAARTGHPADRALVLEIARTVPCAVQSGGGVRSEHDVRTLLDGGVARVVMGTTAVSNPAVVHQIASVFPGQVAVGLDHRGGGSDVAVSGWEKGSGTSLREALAAVERAALGAVIVTTIEHDGMMAGPDLDTLATVLGWTRHEVVASGGVRDAEDLRRLNALEAGGRRLAGAIVGRALVDGSLEIEEALAACAP